MTANKKRLPMFYGAITRVVDFPTSLRNYHPVAAIMLPFSRRLAALPR